MVRNKTIGIFGFSIPPIVDTFVRKINLEGEARGLGLKAENLMDGIDERRLGIPNGKDYYFLHIKDTDLRVLERLKKENPVSIIYVFGGEVNKEHIKEAYREADHIIHSSQLGTRIDNDLLEYDAAEEYERMLERHKL